MNFTVHVNDERVDGDIGAVLLSLADAVGELYGDENVVVGSDPHLNDPCDLRLEDEEELRDQERKLIAAAMSGQLGAYACDFRGVRVTALACIGPGGGIPLAILLPQEEWMQTPHATGDYGPVKVWPTVRRGDDDEWIHG